MMERLIAKDLDVTCSDGSCHQNVELWFKDGKRIYKAVNGCKLCVEKINGGVFLIPPDQATMVVCHCPMEVD